MFLSADLSAGDIILKLIQVLGGLGLFLYGINQMGDSLKAVAGNKLKSIIEKTTNTPIKGVLGGTVVTAVIQSSSGTTALTVGLVRAGLMTFPQAIGVILGANIGATITSFFIGLNIEKYALLFVGIGALMIFFIKHEKGSEIGKIIFGFGMLFFGLDTMGNALNDILKAYENQSYQLFTFISDYPILGLIIGTALTALVQSSSAIIGILQTLYSQGFIGMFGAIPIMLGCNIGTTITACVACIGGGVQAKRTAFVHVMFNVIGAILFMALLWPFSQLMEIIEGSMLSGLGPKPKMSIAVAHLIFNFITTFIMFFLIKFLV
ncbi:MAG: Na/Pi symporter, partial [Anaeroplasmataceae bacterium]|nr:Na/Pi symporter [Anaeroplasmataceae bacterium]